MIPAGIRGKVADALTFGNPARQSITLEIVGKAKSAGVDNATLVEIKRGLDALNPIEFDAVVKSDGALDEITQRFKAAPGIREAWTKNLTDQEGPLDIEEGAITPDIIAGLKTVSQDAREKLIAERAQRAAPASAPPSPTPKPAGRTRKPKPAEPVVKVEEEPVAVKVEEEPVVVEAPKPVPKKAPAKKPAEAPAPVKPAPKDAGAAPVAPKPIGFEDKVVTSSPDGKLQKVAQVRGVTGDGSIVTWDGQSQLVLPPGQVRRVADGESDLPLGHTLRDDVAAKPPRSEAPPKVEEEPVRGHSPFNKLRDYQKTRGEFAREAESLGDKVPHSPQTLKLKNALGQADSSLYDATKAAREAGRVVDKDLTVQKYRAAVGEAERVYKLKRGAEIDKAHYNAVKQALAEGKPVPAEVLKDYPDLVAKPTAAPAPVSKGVAGVGVEVDPARDKWLQKNAFKKWHTTFGFNDSLKSLPDDELDTLLRQEVGKQPKYLNDWADSDKERIGQIYNESEFRSTLAKAKSNSGVASQYKKFETDGQWSDGTTFPKPGDKVQTVVGGIMGLPQKITGTVKRTKDGRYYVSDFPADVGGARTLPLTKGWKIVDAEAGSNASKVNPNEVKQKIQSKGDIQGESNNVVRDNSPVVEGQGRGMSDATTAPKDAPTSTPTTPKTGAEMREELLANKPKPKKRLKGGTKAGAINIDPEEIDWYIRYASTYVKDGADWVKQVVNDFGDEVKPYIEEIRKGLIKAGLIAEEERKGPARVDKGPVKMDNAGTPITVANTPDPLKPVSQGGGIDDETRKIRAEANPMSETQAKGEAMPDSEVTSMVDKIYADPSDKLPAGIGDIEVVAAALAKQMRTVSGQIKEAVLAGNNDKADRLQKKLNRTVVAFRKTQNTAGRGLAGMKVAYDPDELITSDNVADIVGRLSENEDVTKAAAPMVKAATKLLSDAEKGIADATKDKTTIQKAYEELSKENAGLKRTVKTFLDAARDTFVTGEKQITTQERSWAEKNLFISPKNASSKNQASAISVNHKALAILIQDTLENGALTLRDAVQNIQKKFGVTISDEDVANSVAIMRTHNLQREAEKTAARIRKNATSDADIAIADDLVDGAKKLSGKVKQATSPKKSPEPGMEGVHPRHIDAIKAVRDSLEEQDDAIKEFAESLDDTLAKILADGKEQGLATPVKRGFTPEQAKIYGELRRQLNAIKKGATSGKVTTVVTSEWNQELVDAINNAVEVAKDFAKKNNLPDADMVKEWEQLKRGSATADAMLANLPETLDPAIRDQIVTMVGNALPGDKLKVAKILLSQYTPKVAKTVAADSKAVSEAREWLAINNAKVVAGANVSNVATLKEAEDLARKIGTANAAINKALGSMNRKDYNALMEQSRQLFDIRRELRNRMSDLNYQLGNKSDTEKAWARAASILNIPRTIKASGDVSFASRQGGALAAANPAIWKHLWGGQMKAVFKNKNNAARYMEDLASKIRKTEVYDVYSRAIGSSDTKADDSVKFNFDSGGHEEQYEFVPKVVRENAMIRKSDDAYAAAGDIVRWKALEMFHNKLVRHYAKRGMSVPEADIRRVAEFVNIATGKGHGDFAKALGSHPSVGLMFFAPRFRWSRIQYTSLYPGRRAIQIITGVTRKSAQGASFADVLIAGEYLKFMGLRAAQYGTAAALLGAETSMDPDSDLFGKLKMGNFTYDMSGGFAQPMKLGWAMTKGAVAGAQVASSQQDSASREAAYAKGGKAGDDILRTVRGSLSPIPGVVWTMAKGGQTITGQQLAPLNTGQGALDYAEQLFVPITATDMAAGAKQARNDGDPAIVGMAKSLPGAVGIGVSAYERGPQPKTEAEKMVKAIGGTKSFGAMTPRTNEQRVAMTKVTNMLEQKGRPATGQARKMLKAAFPDVAPERINEMVENAAVPTLQKVSGMSLPQMIAVLRVATDAEVLEIHRKAGWGEKLLPGSNYAKEKLMGKGNLPAAEAKKLINEYRDRVKKARGNASRK
jgi:hypothetical protein